MLRLNKLRRALIVAIAAAAGLGGLVARGGDPPLLAQPLVAAFDAVFKGPYGGARAIHAKGIVATGMFEPEPEAAALSAAPHLRAGEKVPVLVRFSAFSGIPTQADGRPGGNPTGMAIKFQLPDGIDTDIVAHAYDGFPAGTPQEFLDLLKVLASGDDAARRVFLSEHAAASRFVEAAKPTPVSYGTETFFGVNAFRFTNAAAVSHFGRYRIYPASGSGYFTAAESAALDRDYLNHELERRLRQGPVRFRLAVQLAGPGDVVTDGATAWPGSRPEVTLGTLELRDTADEQDPKIRNLFFNPMNLVPGIAASGDPMLAARTRAYAVSYRRRSEAE